MQKGKYILLFLLFVCGNMFAVENEMNLSLWQTIAKDIHSVINDFSETGSNFSTAGLKDLHYSSQIIAFDILVMNNDEGIRKIFQKNRTEKLDNFFNVTNNFGGTYSAIGLPVTVYLSGLISGSEEIRKTGRQLGEVLILAGVIDQTTKIIAGRARPYKDLGNGVYKPFNTEDGFFSFPSGHTTVAFAFASILSEKIDRWWAYPLCYGMAASTGLARIYYDKHWASDVIMGAAIGIFSGEMILHSDSNKSAGNTSLLISPTGICLAWNF